MVARYAVLRHRAFGRHRRLLRLTTQSALMLVPWPVLLLASLRAVVGHVAPRALSVGGLATKAHAARCYWRRHRAIVRTHPVRRRSASKRFIGRVQLTHGGRAGLRTLDTLTSLPRVAGGVHYVG